MKLQRFNSKLWISPENTVCFAFGCAYAVLNKTKPPINEKVVLSKLSVLTFRLLAHTAPAPSTKQVRSLISIHRGRAYIQSLIHTVEAYSGRYYRAVEYSTKQTLDNGIREGLTEIDIRRLEAYWYVAQWGHLADDSVLAAAKTAFLLGGKECADKVLFLERKYNAAR